MNKQLLFFFNSADNQKTSNNDNDDDPCKGKADGKYPLRNIFSYLTCKKGKGTVSKCPVGQIYYPTTKTCGQISRTSLPNFCRQRSDGDWQNPWNCNRYIYCSKGKTQVRPCLINGFIYNPSLDVCLQSSPCVVIPTVHHGDVSSQIENQAEAAAATSQARSELDHHHPLQIKDICTYLKDGNYSTRDVLSFLQCKNKTNNFISCPVDTIYVKGDNCTDAKTINEGRSWPSNPTIFNEIIRLTLTIL